jgi:acyl-homoserine lactone acylase PvdQ
VDVADPNREGIHSSGPSTRFQCEGLQPVQCTVQLPGGQSAHVDSDHYEDLLPLWLDNEPIDLVFDIDEAASQAVETFEF